DSTNELTSIDTTNYATSSRSNENLASNSSAKIVTSIATSYNKTFTKLYNSSNDLEAAMWIQVF
ncbi:14721_t:CDS:2, partial [Dentiscutata erythropus]